MKTLTQFKLEFSYTQATGGALMRKNKLVGVLAQAKVKVCEAKQGRLPITYDAN